MSSLDQSSFNRAAAQFLASSKREPGAVLRQQAKLFIRDVIAFTPPFPKNAISASLNEHRKVGLQAVAKDIRKLFMPISKMKMVQTPDNPKLARKILGYIRSGDFAKLRALVPFISPKLESMISAGHLIPAATSQIHNAHRGTNGRVIGGRPIIVMNEATITALIKKEQAKVGSAKAGWVAAARAFGVAVPNWISRNPTSGFVSNKSDNTLTPSIEIANLVKDAGTLEGNLGIVARALRQRTRAMMKQLEHWQSKAAAQFNR